MAQIGVSGLQGPYATGGFRPNPVQQQTMSNMRGAGETMGEQAAPYLMGGKMKARRLAMNEGSDQKAEDAVKKYAYLVSTTKPDEWKYLISGDTYWQDHPKGLEYLFMLLEEQTPMQTGGFTPGQTQAYQQQTAPTIMGGLGGMRGAAPPALQPGLGKMATPYMPGVQERYRPTGATPEQGQEFYKAMEQFGLQKPATKAEQAKTLVGGGMFEPQEEIIKNYKDFLVGKEQKYYEIGGKGANEERSLSGLLTMGQSALNEGFDVQDLMDKYEALSVDKELLSALGFTEVPARDYNRAINKGEAVYGVDKDGGVTGVNWNNWDNAKFEAKGWREKLSTFFLLLNAIPDLDEEAQDWIYFNWLGGGRVEPAGATREKNYMSWNQLAPRTAVG